MKYPSLYNVVVDILLNRQLENSCQPHKITIENTITPTSIDGVVFNMFVLNNPKYIYYILVAVFCDNAISIAISFNGFYLKQITDLVFHDILLQNTRQAYHALL